MVITHVYDPKYWDIWFEGTPYNSKPKVTKVAKDWCSTAKAEVCYNLAFFQMSTGATVNYVKAKGSDVGYGGIADRLTVSPGNIVGGYAVGIRGNEIVIRSDGTTRTRNGIGLTSKGNIIIAQTTTKITEKNFCKEVGIQVNQYYKEGIKLFLMEDGGGSTQMYSNISKLGISPEGGRKVPTVTCVKRKQLPKFTRVLKTGCTGEDVGLYQMVIGGLVCDRSFGNDTKKRTKEAQKELKRLGLYTGAIDGICGPLMFKALGLR